MAGVTVTSSEFNRDSGAAKKAARNGPVIITERGTPSRVLMTWADYEAPRSVEVAIAEALAIPGVEDIPFDPPKLDDRPAQPDLG